MWLLFYALFALTLYYVYTFYKKRSQLPPGPLPLPIVGNLLSLRNLDRWEVQFNEWKQKYGNVYTFYMGNKPSIFINDYETLIKHVVKDGDVFTGRLRVGGFSDLVRGGQYGVIDTVGDFWTEQRRFALKVFRDFGLSKSQMEGRVLTEVEYITDKFGEDISAGIQEIDICHHMDIVLGSVINTVVCGYRFTDGCEDEFYKLKSLTTKGQAAIADPITTMAFFNEWMFKVPYLNRNPMKAVDNFKQIFDHLDQQIQKHLDRNDYHDENFEANDYIDAFLVEKAKQDVAGENKTFIRIQLINMCFDLWVAGQETTSSTMAWLPAFLINKPEVQQKAHEELDRVVGSGRPVTMNDKKDLHYINAIITEVQRVANIIVMNVPHTNLEDTVIDGHFIPKDTIIIPQIGTLMWDEKHFPKPADFDPSRHLDENGKFMSSKYIMPFSLGKRACLGEGLARMELFLFTANIINRFKFSSGKTLPELKRKQSGQSPFIRDYKCKVARRY